MLSKGEITPPCGTPFLPEAFSMTFRMCMISASLTRCATLPTPVVPDIVKVGSQVEVEDARLPLDYCLGYSLDRVMCCPLGTISKRSRLEIRPSR